VADDRNLRAHDVPLGSSAALTFAQVFGGYGGYVLGLLRRLGVADADVEDVAQEVFLTVHAKLPEFEGRSQVKTWVCGICLRKAAEYRRKAYRRRELPSDLEPIGVEISGADDSLLRKQRAKLLLAALARLPDKQREVFVLYELEELPILEIARMLGCPRFTVYTRLRTARAAVRAFFQEQPDRRTR
jgi:RNA polymerase sigma-70 factor (ECF subfamily)